MKDKLAINLANAGKMASNWVMTICGALGAAYLTLPVKCLPEEVGCVSQSVVLGHLFVPAWSIPLVAAAVGVVARIWPQRSITPAVAAAKSTDAEQPEGKQPP